MQPAPCAIGKTRELRVVCVAPMVSTPDEGQSIAEFWVLEKV